MMIRRGASQGHMTVSVPEAPSIIDAKSIVLTGDVSSGETMGPEDEVLIS